MQGRWMIVDNHIALATNNQLFHPSADELYAVIEDAQNTFADSIDCDDIHAAFPNLRFSKIGTGIKCVLTNINEKIHISFVCERKGKTVDVDVINGMIVDQCVCDNEWFYVTGSTQEIESVLQSAKINSSGTITVSQYIEMLLKQESFFPGTLINQVESSLLDKPINANGFIPTQINANLYEYQRRGFFWLKYMLEENKGCILGDEMGLGKTLQVITVMQDYKNNNKSPMLVVAPVSLLQNWLRECNRFAPELKIFIHHGAKRTGRYKDLEVYDVVVVSYGTAVSDTALLTMMDWSLVVLDEAQNIKNPGSERTKFVKLIPRESCIAVSGTPFENHVSDIWSIVDFVKPGLLGTQSEFDSYITDDVAGGDKIEPVLSSLMIRRLVADVAKDLPDKVVIPQPIVMSDREIVDYEEFRKAALSGEKNPSLASLQKMRMYCTHPQLCNSEEDRDPWGCSVKYQRMCEILQEIQERNEKVIMFTSYQKMFDILEIDIPKRLGMKVYKIDGRTNVPDRQPIVDEFNEFSGSALLVLNPRAAGTGLNITSANHVIHYNLEWNPSLEDQASARAYRRGQKKTVFVYRLFYTDTVEEIVNERIERKRSIAKAAVVGTDGSCENKEDIISALNISPLRSGGIYD